MLQGYAPSISPLDYIEVLNDFNAHWTHTNSELSPSALVVYGGYGQPDLDADRAELDQLMINCIEQENEVEGLRVDRDNMKADVRERIRQFCAVVRGVHAGTIYPEQLVRLPGVKAGPGKWIPPMDHIESLWLQLNGDLGPLTLTGGYTQAQFAADVAALKTLFTQMAEEERKLTEAIMKRDDKFRQIYSKLVLYRQTVKGSFPLGHPRINTLPRLTRKRKPKKQQPELLEVES